MVELSYEAISRILAAQDAKAGPGQIAHYPTLEALSEKARGSRHWGMGETFVWAESPEKFLILTQIAPDSCEMLVISHNGYHNVLTAYRFEQDELVAMLDGYVNGGDHSMPRARA